MFPICETPAPSIETPGLSGNENTILVTGGAGYIGSHACKALHRAGYRPVAYDNLSRGHREAVRWGPLVEGDLNDPARLAKTFREHRPAGVVHFAALAYVGESGREPNLYYRNNVEGTRRLLESMCAADCRRIVISSSCATYGVPKRLPIAENHPQNPINPYGCTKLIGEQMLLDFGAAYGLRAVFLRYFNAAGTDPDGELGEDHDPETHLIPNVLRAAAGRMSAVEVFGTDYDTPDGTCVRDYIHVADLADAHVLALRHLESGAATEAFNLGNGEGYSVRQVIDAARLVSRCNLCVELKPRRRGDPARLVANARRARETLGWAPRFPAIQTQIEHAWCWMQRGAR
jgi:UDP-arabinose 4-epimerase